MLEQSTQLVQMQKTKYDKILIDLLKLSNEDPTAIAAACAHIHHWKNVLDAAERHGVFGLLYRQLHKVFLTNHKEIRQSIDNRQAISEIWSEHLNQTLDAILIAMKDHKVDVVALKGPVLSERLYGTVFARRSTDIDLLIRESALPMAIAAVEKLGYCVESGVSSEYHRAFHHHLCLTHVRRPPLELHFRLFTGFGVSVASERFLDASQPYQRISGSSCSVLVHADELLYLCVHAAGHLCDRLAWLYDIKKLIDQDPAIQWPAVFEQAKRLELAAAFSFAIAMTHATFGIEDETIPGLIGRYLRNGYTVRSLRSQFGHWPSSSLPAKILALLIQAALCDRPTLSMTVLLHYLGRVTRRRIFRMFPHLVSENWSA